MRHLTAYIHKVRRHCPAMFCPMAGGDTFIDDNPFALRILDRYGLPYCDRYLIMINHGYPFDNPMRDADSYAREIHADLLVAVARYQDQDLRTPVEILNDASANHDKDPDTYQIHEVLPLLPIQYPPTYYHAFLYYTVLIEFRTPAAEVWNEMRRADKFRSELSRFIHHPDREEALMLKENLSSFGWYLFDRWRELKYFNDDEDVGQNSLPLISQGDLYKN